MKEFKDLIRPQEYVLEGKTFYISKFPAVDGRAIISEYATSNLPLIGNSKLSKDSFLKLMACVAVKISEEANVVLVSEALINNHFNAMEFPWQAQAKIEVAMMEYNCSFFQNGRASTLCEEFGQTLKATIAQILTHSLRPLLPKD